MDSGGKHNLEKVLKRKSCRDRGKDEEAGNKSISMKPSFIPH